MECLNPNAVIPAKAEIQKRCGVIIGRVSSPCALPQSVVLMDPRLRGDDVEPSSSCNPGSSLHIVRDDAFSLSGYNRLSQELARGRTDVALRPMRTAD